MFRRPFRGRPTLLALGVFISAIALDAAGKHAVRWFVEAAVLLVGLGNDRRAAEILEEVLTEQAELNQLGFASMDSYALAWLALTLDREEEVAELLNSDPLDTPWIRAGKAVLAGDLAAGADLLGEIGARTQEAFLRLRAAEQLVEEGRRAEADEQLNRALAFYRSVGATRYVREGEALLAASA